MNATSVSLLLMKGGKKPPYPPANPFAAPPGPPSRQSRAVGMIISHLKKRVNLAKTPKNRGLYSVLRFQNCPMGFLQDRQALRGYSNGLPPFCWGAVIFCGQNGKARFTVYWPNRHNPLLHPFYCGLSPAVRMLGMMLVL
jgi:hypothetical protein